MSSVAERAILARERSDGRYSVATSRWGGTDRALAAVCAGRSPIALRDVTWEPGDERPNFHSVVEQFDYLSMAVCYRVRPTGTIVYLSLWAGLPLTVDTARSSAGALVAVESLPDARTVRRWFRQFKGSIADEISRGNLPVSAAPRLVYAAIASLTDRERYLSILPGTAERLSPGTGPDRM